MKNTKAIFIDSEGTLRNKDKQISLETSEIIKKLESVGIHVVITTGLPRFLSQNISLKANASKYLISSNGADIYDLSKSQSIKSSFIDKEVLEELYNLSNYDYNLIFGVGDFEYSNLANEYNLKAKSLKNIADIKEGIYQMHISQKPFDIELDNYIVEIRNFRKYFDLTSIKLVISETLYQKLTEEKISKLTTRDICILVRLIRYLKLFYLQKDILKRYSNYLTVGNQSLDFQKFQYDGETPWFSLNKNGVSKGNGIINLCEYLGIDPKDTIAIGNDYNDKSMKECVGEFICPSDARSFVKEDSNLIYDNQEGISKVLKKIYERR